HEAYAYVENIRKYQISLVGYLMEKEKKAEQQRQLAEAYPVALPGDAPANPFAMLPFGPFSQAAEPEKNRLTVPNNSGPVRPQ
ncbi:MAG TPA: lytic transglycosylase F, partial [Enterobacteriaceae bacterium]|nr:lytic transglycosylase F [Enterobacteriaceae bacterium]